MKKIIKKYIILLFLISINTINANSLEDIVSKFKFNIKTMDFLFASHHLNKQEAYDSINYEYIDSNGQTQTTNWKYNEMGLV